MQSNEEPVSSRARTLAVLCCTLAALNPGAAHAEPQPLAAQQVVPTTDMLGPFPSLSAYCNGVVQKDQGRCARAPTLFARGWKRGERGAFSSATTLVVRRTLGPHSIETCHVALQTPRGVYISANEATCAGPARGEQRQTALTSLHWADLLGSGVLAANRELRRRIRVDEFRWWGEQYVETDVVETQTQLCGLLPNGTPACTAPLAITCQNESDVHQRDGSSLVSNPTPEARLTCSGALLPQGKYRLPFANLALTSDEAATSETGAELPPPVAQPLAGPFSSLAAYCAEPLTYYDPFAFTLDSTADFQDFDADSEPTAATSKSPIWIKDPLAGSAKCLHAPGAWNRPRLRGNGRLLSVSLLRVQGDLAGAPVESCHVAITTKAGTFVTTDTSPCQGMIGPDVEIVTRALSLGWADKSAPNVVRLVLQTDLYDHGRSVILCGVGNSGVPSCSGRYPLQCMAEDTTTKTLELSYDKGFVHLRELGAAPEQSSYTSCSDYDEPLPLLFP